MHHGVDLAKLDWTVEGWREWEWLLGTSLESASERTPDIRPIPAIVPGSVRDALVRADVVPDPRVASQSRESEFLEHRHWIFRTRLPQGIEIPGGSRAELRFVALDGRGAVYLGGEHIADFAHAFVPSVIVVPPGVNPAGAELAIVFHSPPPDLGQVGWTSRRRDWKPRFNYGWDWTPRIVQTAIAGAATLDVVSDDVIEGIDVRTTYDADSGRGVVEAVVRSDAVVDGELEITLAGEGRVIARTSSRTAGSALRARLETTDIEPWTPMANSPRTYQVTVRVEAQGVAIAHVGRSVGFRQITWTPTADAPPDAEPWLCAVNGEPLFLQGINWVPLRADWADASDDEYRSRLETYRGMGVNVIRVWGGSTLERPVFYELCDELGMLVWQELPLCSSGIDNYPPDDPSFVAEFARIAQSYVARVGHHACIALWGGGNELAGRRDQMDMGSAPLSFAHPALGAAREVFERLGVDAKVVPTSPSGPAFYVDPAEQSATNGRGLHHDVHGPWAFEGEEADWDRYWLQDDAMLRSEVGAAGASGRDLLEEFGLWVHGERPPVWDHSSAWWVTDEVCTDESIRVSQMRQARRLAAAARASKQRYPACAGFIVWMGHDAFPCAVSLALLDVHGRPKPAALALAKVFAEPLSAGD